MVHPKVKKLKGFQELQARNRAKLVKHHRRGAVFTFPERGSNWAYAKVYRGEASLSRILADLFRPARAQREAKVITHAKARGIAVPEVLGKGARRKFGFVIESHLKLMGIDAKVFETYAKELETASERRELVTALASAIGGMHAEGVFHGNLDLTNILIKREVGKLKVFFIDFETGKVKKKLSQKDRLRDLAELNYFVTHRLGPKVFTAADRLRFWRAYLKSNPLEGAERDVISKITRLTERTRRRKEQ